MLLGIFPSVDLIDLFSRQLALMQEGEASMRESHADCEDAVKAEGSEDVQSLSLAGTSSSSSRISTAAKDSAKESQEVVADISSVKSKAVKESNSKYYNSAMLTGNVRLSSLVEKFVSNSKLDGNYYLCDHANLILVSNWLHSIPLTLSER